MLPSLIAASAALMSLVGRAQSTPQGGFAGQSTTTTSSLAVATIQSVDVRSLAAASISTTACNNSPLLCDRNYNNITHMGAHDAAFLRDSSTSFSVSGNQFYNATTALSAGIRLLQAQVHNLNGVLELCHTTCALLDGGTLESFLSDIKGWMDANPNEVVTLLLVNSDNESAATFGSAYSSSGISTYGYSPPTTASPIAIWPTLQTLITANTRLVTFIASITYDSNYPYLLPEFSYVFETAFGVLSLDGFNCTLDRPNSLSSSTAATGAGYMGLLNHFADSAEAFFAVPDVTNITTTNSPSISTTGAAGLHGKTCATQWGVKPTFILVDFWNVGPSIATADLLNGITGTGRTNTSTDILTASSSSDGILLQGFVSSRLRMAGWAMAVIAIGNFVWL